MGMPKLYMALAVARLKDGRLETVGAGMPPALVYRPATDQTGTITLKGLPLGAPRSVPHRTETLVVSDGDTVLFMSDGLPELRSEDGELLGNDRVHSAFEEVASHPPDAIIEHLKTTCRRWTNGRDADDDVTLVVLKVRATAAFD